MESMSPTLPVIFLLGPTASGKTGVGLELAQREQCQLISCDSSLVYRGMDIGSAKPTEAEQAAAPHRLIDLCEPSEPYSVAQYCEDAKREIDRAREKDRIPVLLGGTMLYFNALEKGLASMPAADDDIRHKLMEQGDRLGWDHMHSILASVDSVAAEKIHPNDPQRIQRALEVYELTGRPISQWQQDQSKEPPAFLQPLLKVGLFPSDRMALHTRIAERFELMLGAGFLDEMRALQSDARNHAMLPSMRSVGYRQAWQYLNDEISMDEFRQKTLAATRQLAKRQLTWMRGMQDLLLLDSLALSQGECVDQIMKALRQLQ